MNVFLKYTLLVILQVVHIVDDRDTSASAQIGWLANPQTFFVAIFVEEIDELLIFVG
jgi:hypothetical protein